jgi:predicted nucleic acid-binding protein
MSSFGVVLDACALFPNSLRDTLLRASRANLYRLQLTDDLLEEMRRNLVKKRISEQKAQALVELIKSEFAESFITHHHLLIGSMPVNEKDRHVLAAAVATNAQVIVTQNLKHFPPRLLEPFGVEAQSPDEFLVHLFYFDPERVLQVLHVQAETLRKPPKTVEELLDTLMTHAPRFVSLARVKLKGEDVSFNVV